MKILFLIALGLAAVITEVYAFPVENKTSHYLNGQQLHDMCAVTLKLLKNGTTPREIEEAMLNFGTEGSCSQANGKKRSLDNRKDCSWLETLVMTAVLTTSHATATALITQVLLLFLDAWFSIFLYFINVDISGNLSLLSQFLQDIGMDEFERIPNDACNVFKSVGPVDFADRSQVNKLTKELMNKVAAIPRKPLATMLNKPKIT